MSVAQIDTLRRILSAAQSGARRYASHAQPRQYTPTSTITNLRLPLPEPLTSRLVIMGIDESSSERISSIVMRIVQSFKDNLDTDFRRRCQALGSQASCLQDGKFLFVLSSNYRAVFSMAVRDWTTYVLEDFTPRLLRARQFRHDSLKRSSFSHKRPFNHGAVPALERFFEENAFPSRLEKYELASKFDMTYRQIEVWFQNHRTRLRKEGKELRQSNTRSVLAEELERSVIDKLLPVDPEEEVYEGSHVDADGESLTSSSPETSSRCSGFQLSTSMHAFPSPYPPLCAYDPFPMAPEKRKFELPWLRSRQSGIPNTNIPITMEQLAVSLTKLTLADNSLLSYSPIQSSPPRRQPLIGFTTPCCRAPLPSLVRQNYQSSMPYSPGYIFGDSTRCQTRPRIEHRPRASLLTTQGGTAPASSISKPSVAQLKKRSLPRRIPRGTPRHHRASASTAQPTFAADAVSLPTSVSSSPSSTTSTFSLASVSSSSSSSTTLPLSRPTSSSSPRSVCSSSASDVDSPLSTPKLLPLAPSSNDAITILTDLKDQVWLGDRPVLQLHGFFLPAKTAPDPLSDCFLHKQSFNADTVPDSFVIA